MTNKEKNLGGRTFGGEICCQPLDLPRLTSNSAKLLLCLEQEEEIQDSCSIPWQLKMAQEAYMAAHIRCIPQHLSWYLDFEYAGITEVQCTNSFGLSPVPAKSKGRCALVLKSSQGRARARTHARTRTHTPCSSSSTAYTELCHPV